MPCRQFSKRLKTRCLRKLLVSIFFDHANVRFQLGEIKKKIKNKILKKSNEKDLIQENMVLAADYKNVKTDRFFKMVTFSFPSRFFTLFHDFSYQPFFFLSYTFVIFFILGTKFLFFVGFLSVSIF